MNGEVSLRDSHHRTAAQADAGQIWHELLAAASIGVSVLIFEHVQCDVLSQFVVFFNFQHVSFEFFLVVLLGKITHDSRYFPNCVACAYLSSVW